MLEKSALGVIDVDMMIECVQVSVVGETVNVTGQSSVTPVKVPTCRLSDDLGSLFERAAFSDVTLVVSDRHFHAHKAVLAGLFVTHVALQLDPN